MMKVQFAQIFQTKTRNEWVMTSAMLDRSPSPCYSAISKWHNKNVESFSKESMTVHGFKQFHLNSGGSFQKKISHYFSFVFLPASGRRV